MPEIIDHYNFNKSSVNVLMLNASKAFDRVNYCKLFAAPLKRTSYCFKVIAFYVHSPIIACKVGNTLSEQFL